MILSSNSKLVSTNYKNLLFCIPIEQIPSFVLKNILFC